MTARLCSISFRLFATALAGGLVLLAGAAAQAKGRPAPRVPAQLTIDIRNTADPADDYVTWAPAPAQLRLTLPPARHGKPAAKDTSRVVYLTNAAAPVSGSGHVNFAADAAAYRKAVDSGAAQDTIRLSVSAGQPATFVVAGAFPYFSRADKDVTILAHADSPTGPVIAARKLMVRVRRNLETMTPDEKNRFLWALAKLRFHMAQTPTGNSYFDLLVAIHDIGAKGYPDLEPGQDIPDDAYPDQEHKGPAFLAWHRAFLLQMERALQKIDPSVAIPYWPIYRTPTPASISQVFQLDFTGSNSITPSATPGKQSPYTVAEPTSFAPGNPLYGWHLPDRGVLTRWTYNRLIVNFLHPGDLIRPIDPNPPHPVQPNTSQDSYYVATNSIESDPHNVGHGWSGPWMSNCRISPSDPLFWPFHSYFDWQWAAWQQYFNRYGVDGSDPKNYWPNDSFSGTGGPAHQAIGHHLFDTMWPWNGATTDPKSPPTFVARRPPQAPGGAFPASGTAGVWPQQAAEPRPADMIDYQGYVSSGDDTDFGYDTIPWSPAQTMAPFPGDVRPLPGALAMFLDTSQPLAARVAAADRVDLTQAAAPDALAQIRGLVVASRSAPALKVAALQLLERTDTTQAVAAASAIARSARDAELVKEIRTALALRMFAGRSGDASMVPAAVAAPRFTDDQRATDYANMRGAVTDPSGGGYVATMVVAQLNGFLASPTTVQEFPPQDAIDFLVASNYLAAAGANAMGGMAMTGANDDPPPPDPETVRAVLRKVLELDPATPVDPGVQLWQAKGLASLALMSDPGAQSIARIQALIRDGRAPDAVRGMALLALSHTGGAAFAATAKEIADNTALSDELRAHAAAAIGAYVLDNAGRLLPAELAVLAAQVQPWTSGGQPPQFAAAAQTAATLIAYSSSQMEHRP